MMGQRATETIAAYLAYLRLRGMSSATSKRRRSSLHAFARWCHPLCVTDADRDHVEGWLRLFAEPRTRKAYRSDLSDFYQWALRRQVVATNPVALTDGIRVPKSLPRPVPPHAVPGIIAAAPDGPLRLGLMLAAYAGLRRAEICALTGHDVQLYPEPLIVVRQGKGAKDRLVPMHPALRLELADAKGGGRLVGWSPDHLGTVAADHMRRLGYDCTLHQLRASFATELARALDGNVIAVGRVLGHESPTTTMGYVGWDGGAIGVQMPRLYVA